MFKSFRQLLVLVLFAFLPLHAFLVTVGTKVIAGVGHAPLSYLAARKEGVIALVLVIGILEMGTRIVASCKLQVASVCNWRSLRVRWVGGFDTIIIVLLLVIAVLLGASHHAYYTTQFIFGFKYLFAPLIFYLLLKNLEWDEGFIVRRIFPTLLISGSVIALYGIASFFLPMSWFTVLGYSDAHSLYAPGSSLSAFQQIGESGIRRIQSTMSGPNQLGIWLLIPWSIGLVMVLRRGVTSYKLQVTSCFIVAVALLLTFSRSAWIAAFLITWFVIMVQLRGKVRAIVFGGFISLVLVAFFAIYAIAPNIVARGLSNRHHMERLQDGVRIIIENPWGLGLGSAGPASNRTSDACLYFDPGADISWAHDRSDLCLFVGGEQMQPSPSGKICSCPLLPENWYVQVGIELGVMGGLLFTLLIVHVLFSMTRLQVAGCRLQVLSVYFAFIGVCIASLFLHAWEDSAVAYTVWGLIGITLSQKHAKN